MQGEADAETQRLIVQVNKHYLNPCTEKCQIMATEHVIEEPCGACARREMLVGWRADACDDAKVLSKWGFLVEDA